MRKNHFLVVWASVTMMFLNACGGDKDEVKLPGAAKLLTPSANTVCVKGAATNEVGKSKVTFSWQKAVDAEQYRIDVNNLNSNASVSQTVAVLTCDVNLDVESYYSWCVTAINADGSTSSDTLQFYLSGTPASNYAPFPADLTFPLQGAIIDANGANEVSVTFKWDGSDLDDDIVGYSFYLDNQNASTEVLSSLNAANTTQTLTRGKTYFWKVMTMDAAGNSSTSAVVSFKVE